MTEARLPAQLEALIQGPCDTDMLARLKDYFAVGDPASPERADEILLVAEQLGERATPEISSFLNKQIAAFFMTGLTPMR
jgi:hypothetical protein